MNRRTLNDISEKLRSIEERLFELESYMQEFLAWRRRDEILRRVKRQRGRVVVTLFPRKAVRS